MKTYYFTSIILFSHLVNAQNINQPENIKNLSIPNFSPEKKITIPHLKEASIGLHMLNSIEASLNEAISLRDFPRVKRILEKYKSLESKDKILILFAEGSISYSEENYRNAISKFREALSISPSLTPIRIELAKAYFLDYQDNNAKVQFQESRRTKNIPNVIIDLIDLYLTEIKQRNKWQFYINGHYIRDENVNNSSRNRNIENTGFSKSDEMLPKKAHGIGYNFGLNKDFNVVNSHYLYLSTQIDGKLHWDNRNYDDIYTRNYLGYKYKKKSYTLSLLPLYEKRWYSNKRYQWGNGIRAEYQKWISQNWQVSSAIEYTKQRYFRNSNQNSYNQLFSSTILWKRNLKQFFYFGIDINKEKSNEKQYSYNSQGVRLGWGQEWKYNISSRINLGISHRKFKDKAILGGILPLGKARQDKIFYVNLSLWNNNWHLWGILPKLNLAWKQQKSNIPTMYSYSERDIRLNFEKDF